MREGWRLEPIGKIATIINGGTPIYFLRLNVPLLNELGSGTTFKELAKSALAGVEIPLPPLPEQKRIVAILDEAFEGIERAVANAEKNLANARELFESYLNAVFTHKGEGWVEKKLSESIDISHGFAFKSSDFETSSDASKAIILTPGNYREDGKLYFTEKNTKRLTGDLPKGYLFDIGDLTVVMTDLSSKMKILGKPAFIDQPNVLHNQRIGRVIFKDTEITPKFIYYFLRTRMVSEKIKETSTGTMVRHTAPKRILTLCILFPPSQSQQASLTSALDRFSSETKHLEAIYQQKLTTLAELKQSLLHKAFTGELTAKPDTALKHEAVA